MFAKDPGGLEPHSVEGSKLVCAGFRAGFPVASFSFLSFHVNCGATVFFPWANLSLWSVRASVRFCVF